MEGGSVICKKSNTLKPNMSLMHELLELDVLVALVTRAIYARHSSD